MKRKTIVIIFFIFIVNTAYATPQIPDMLLYNGKKHSLLQFPLEGYFYQNPNKRPEVCQSTAAWRRYIALYEIKNNKFYVIDINNIYNNSNVIKNTFKGKSEVHLNWWNGMLIIPDGEVLESYNIRRRDFRLMYHEYYKFLEIKNGILINEYRLNNEQYRLYEKIIYNLFSQTDAYNKVYPWMEINDININYELNNGILPNETAEYIKNNYEKNTNFFDYIPIIYYNNLLSIELIAEYVESLLLEKHENKQKVKQRIKSIFLKIIFILCGLCGIIILIVTINKLKKRKG
ncbi:MAG: hypothetical protein FWD28_01240 [Treponema sp.]|nr:hypothetical protein [Treponema sp.]